MRALLLTLGLIAVGLWALLPEYVLDRHQLAWAGVVLLLCWLGLSGLATWRNRRVNAARAGEARLVEAVNEELARARGLLPVSAGDGELGRFYQAILLGDLKSALDELETLGQTADPPPEFWNALASAAARMGLKEDCLRLTARGSHRRPLI